MRLGYLCTYRQRTGTSTAVVVTRAREHKVDEAATAWCVTTNVHLTQIGNFSLNHSTPQVRELFKHVVKEIEQYITFDDAYPDRNPVCKFPWLRDTLIGAAQELGFRPIINRLRRDPEYVKILVDAVSHHV